MNYARIVDGFVAEVILAYFTTEDQWGPGEIDPENPSVTPAPVLVRPAGTEVPIAERFHADIVAQLVEDPNNEAVPNGTYVDGVFGPVPPPPPPTLMQLEGIRSSYMSRATLMIAPLQDAVDLEEATPAEIALLRLWKQYRIALSRLDLTVTPLVWPTAPDA